MGDKEAYQRQQAIKRMYLWSGIIVGIFFTNIVIAPNPLPRPDYVPAIANGLVASASILMALAIFLLTHFHATIKDNNERWRYHNLAMIYVVLLFLALMFGIMLGYRFLLTNELGYTFSCFMTLFIVMCGLIIDMWITSEQFYLK